MDKINLEAAIEGILFASGESVAIERLCEVTSCSKAAMRQTLEKMQADYEQDERRGIKLVRFEEKYQLCTKSEYYDCIRALNEKKGKVTISNAGLEVLSIIAYNQPVTRSTVEFIRGVNSDGAMNKLVELGLIDEVGRLDAPGRPILYATTEEFLRCFSLESLSDLPEVDSDIDISGKSEYSQEEKLTDYVE
ncbi:MAG: SMC-Scp complex subunit ScpB [Ruminococcaceae bacterium]|nr:SMC-Scp complex subunit ScpB [Oscillospiraceae bacterium]